LKNSPVKLGIFSLKSHSSAFADFFVFVLVYLGGPVPRDIYQRIKKLEDKILELEGLSPEYFQSVVRISLNFF